MTFQNIQKIKYGKHGGKIIARGTYGCVYSPALVCKDNKERRPGYISKLMEKDDADIELKEIKEIEKIDPTHIFHLPPPIYCSELEKPDIIHDNLFTDCDFYSQSIHNKFTALDYVDGGTSLRLFLNKYKLSNKQKVISMKKRGKIFLKLFFDMENLFFGLQQLYKNNYLHNDIKSDNIVVKKDKTTEKNVYNYIDFGLSSKIVDAYGSTLYSNEYFAWPMETLFIDYDMRHKLKTMNNEQIMDKLTQKYYQGNSIYIYNQYINGYNIYLAIENSLDLYRKNLKSKEKKNKMIFDIIKKLDVFSLGVVLIEMWEKLTSIKFNNYKSEGYIPKQFENVEVYRKIVDLINTMTQAYHGNRYNGEECYREFCVIKQMMYPGEKGKPLYSNTDIEETRIVEKEKEDISKVASVVKPVSKSKTEKKCPEGKILNPKTGRCINAKGITAKKISMKSKVQPISVVKPVSKSKTEKKCPE